MKKASRKFWRSTGTWLVPIVLISLGVVWILVDSYQSRSSQTSKYVLPADRSAPSMLAFIRSLDGEYDPQATMLKSSNLPAINAAVRGAAEIIDLDRSALSPKELREAGYYRLYYGLLAFMNGDREEDAELDDLAARTIRFIDGSTEVSARERNVAGYAMVALDTAGRTSAALETADLIEQRFSSLPDSQDKSIVLAAVVGLRNRLHLLGSQLNWTTQSLDESSIDTSNLQGTVVLIEFWSTTCGPCIADFPALKRIYNTYHADGFEVLAVCLHASAARIRSFTQEHELPWIQVCHDPVEGNDEWATQFGINAVPSTMLVDQSGKVIAFNIRPLHSDARLDLETNLKRLLKAKRRRYGALSRPMFN